MFNKNDQIQWNNGLVINFKNERDKERNETWYSILIKILNEMLGSWFCLIIMQIVSLDISISFYVHFNNNRSVITKKIFFIWKKSIDFYVYPRRLHKMKISTKEFYKKMRIS